jgi:hypothetical protein
VAQEAHRLTLTEAIESLRRDLDAAQRQGVGRAIGFSVEQITIELDVQAERVSTQEGGVSWFVTAKAGRGRTQRTGTRIVVDLKPHGRIDVSDTTARPRDVPPPGPGPEEVPDTAGA